MLQMDKRKQEISGTFGIKGYNGMCSDKIDTQLVENRP